MIKVGFIINFKSSQWLGGYNYFKNLLKCLDNFPNKRIVPVIITDKKNELLQDELLSKLEIIETQLVSRSSLLIKIFSKMLIVIFNRNFYLDNFLKKYDNRNKILKNNFINIYQSSILKLLNKKKII